MLQAVSHGLTSIFMQALFAVHRVVRLAVRFQEGRSLSTLPEPVGSSAAGLSGRFPRDRGHCEPSISSIIWRARIAHRVNGLTPAVSFADPRPVPRPTALATGPSTRP